MDLGLKDKRVLITGASRGIGAETARRFLEEGARVIIVSRGSNLLFAEEKELQAEFGQSRVRAETCDCTDLSSLEKLADIIEGEWQGLDILVSNVGDGRSLPDALPDAMQWEGVWNVNFDSGLNTARAFLPMLERSNGVLLFVSSIAGLEAFGAPVDYSTAKAALIALSKNMARKLAGNVRVNVLAPGNVYFSGGSWDEKIQNDPVRVSNIIGATVPMERFGTPAEMADAAAFLCSRRASFITGAVLVVDGGQTVGVF